MRPLDLPKSSELNIYLETKRLVIADQQELNNHVRMGLPTDESLLAAIDQAADAHSAQSCILAIDRTLEHFGIPVDKWDKTGDMILRFGLWMSQQNGPVRVENPSKGLNVLLDMYEFYNEQLSKEVIL
jgi:hypothetical protein